MRRNKAPDLFPERDLFELLFLKEYGQKKKGNKQTNNHGVMQKIMAIGKRVDLNMSL